MSARKGQDRRQRIEPVKKERRAKKDRRQDCPQCGSLLLTDRQNENDQVRVTMVCTSSACTYTVVHRMVPMGKIALSGSYDVTLVRSGKGLAVELPLELCHFAKLTAGQRFTLKTLDTLRWNIKNA